MLLAHPIDERFHKKYTPVTESGCWVWLGALVDGYGHIESGASTQAVRDIRLAHRVSWELYHGPIPQGSHVLHRCDVRCCVNPAHLFLGTNAENMADKVQKKRCAKGEVHSRAKLTETQVRAIRADPEDRYILSKRYGVTYSAIYAIQKRYVWKHLKD